MSDLEDGKYQIVFSPPPGPPFPTSPIGINKSSEPIVPLITGGSDNIFTVKKPDDNEAYNIWLPNPDPLFRVIGLEDIEATDVPVVALTTPSSADPTEYTPWNIVDWDGTYQISKPGRAIGWTYCWTVDNPGADQPVMLKPYSVDPSVKKPQWKFIKQ
ncbi:hypothetical protein HD554DRAFT_2112753 [Boletus coccyginus]|nr:hypothetical protein HD554DRAFT_2112753 [Boletus coccyginus]